MMKYFILGLAAFVLSFPAASRADTAEELRLRGLINGSNPSIVNDINRARNRNVILYNGDDGLYIGRGAAPIYRNYNQGAAPALSGDVNVFCGTLSSERKRERCARDVIDAREKLIEKYRE